MHTWCLPCSPQFSVLSCLLISTKHKVQLVGFCRYFIKNQSIRQILSCDQMCLSNYMLIKNLYFMCNWIKYLSSTAHTYMGLKHTFVSQYHCIRCTNLPQLYSNPCQTVWTLVFQALSLSVLHTVLCVWWVLFLTYVPRLCGPLTGLVTLWLCLCVFGFVTRSAWTRSFLLFSNEHVEGKDIFAKSVEIKNLAALAMTLICNL